MTISLPIEVERLPTRPFEPSDVDVMATVYGDPQVMHHICLGTLSRTKTAALLEHYRKAQTRHRRLVAKVEAANVRSLRLAARLGTETVGTLSIHEHPHVLLALDLARA